jgi:hypothetical protein
MLRNEEGKRESRFEGTKKMRGTVKPYVVPTMVQAVRQITIVPQMTSPQERQPRE